MRKTLEDIAKHITDVFLKEKPLNRYDFSEKYNETFDDFVYEAVMNDADLSLHEVAKKLVSPIFIYNEKHTEMMVISPIFALLLGITNESKYEEVKCTDWFTRDFWEQKLPNAVAEEPKLKYETKQGDIPEFMACLKTQEDSLAIHVLRCKHQFNLDKGATYYVNDLPPIFKLDHSDPIHLVRFLMSHNQDR